MLRPNLFIPNDQQIAAFERIRGAYTISQLHLNPEFFAPVIADLDTVSFVNLLSGSILVGWENTTSTPCCLSGKPTVQLSYEESKSGSERLGVRFAIYS
jgi:hypothetical protein